MNIDGFELEPADTEAETPQAPEPAIPISYENFVAQLQARMEKVFSMLMTENAELRAMLQQADEARKDALSKAAAMEEVIADLTRK